MEFWEGAILVAGGVILVRWMAHQKTLAAAASASSGINAGVGTSNQSNLTNITTQAGGYPTIAGEPLEPPQPPVGDPSIPVNVSSTPIPTPITNHPILSNLPRICPAWGCGPTPVFKPIAMPYRPVGTTSRTPAPPVRGTALPISRAPNPVSFKTPTPTPAPVVQSPVVGSAITKSAGTVYPGATSAGTPRVTFSQAVPNLPERPMDQHLQML